jgi:hypothetical protein
VAQALSAASEARQLEELSGAALPKLYAQLYELRRAADASAAKAEGVGWDGGGFWMVFLWVKCHVNYKSIYIYLYTVTYIMLYHVMWL